MIDLNDQIKWLKELKDNHSDVIAEVEKFIDDNYKDFMDFKKDPSKSHYLVTHKAQSIYNDFFKFCDNLQNKYNVSRGSVKLFFSLDKKLFSRILKHKSKYPSESISYLKYTDNASPLKARFRDINGENISSVFSKYEDLVCSFFEEHVDLFPKSTKSFINKKKRDREKVKEQDYPFDKITNDFDFKLFCKSLDEKFKIDKCNTSLAKFQSNSYSENVLSNFYFFKAISSKYVDNFNMNFLNFKHQLLINIIHNTQMSLLSKSMKTPSDLDRFVQLIHKDNNFQKEITNFLSSQSYSGDVLFFFYECVLVLDYKNKLKSNILDCFVLDSDFNLSFDLKKCSLEFRDALFEELVGQHRDER